MPIIFAFSKSTHNLLCVNFTIFLFSKLVRLLVTPLSHSPLICLPLGVLLILAESRMDMFLCSWDQPSVNFCIPAIWGISYHLYHFFFFPVWTLRKKKGLWHFSSTSSGAFCLVWAEKHWRCCIYCINAAQSVCMNWCLRNRRHLMNWSATF